MRTRSVIAALRLGVVASVAAPQESAPAAGTDRVAAVEQPRGLRGRIVENRKEELSDAMKEAIALVKQYVPPVSARIQAAKDAGMRVHSAGRST